jgi:hypothetical protein
MTSEGRYVGQDHPGARLSDAQVDQIRDWHDSGLLGYRILVQWVRREFGLVVSRASIAKIVTCNRRYAVPMRYKTVYVDTPSTRENLPHGKNGATNKAHSRNRRGNPRANGRGHPAR